MHKIYCFWFWAAEAMRIGIFGGSFNPIHYGHLRAAEEVRELFGLEKVIFVPSGSPPLKNSDVAEAYHRFKMTELAISNNPNFAISDFEIRQQAPSYTLNTLTFFKKIYQNDTIFFIIGVDAFYELKFWYKPQQLVRMVDFIVMSRPGFEKFKDSEFIGFQLADNCYRFKDSEKKAFFVSVTPIGISSTQIRTMVRNGKTIRYLVPQKVINYIEQHKLYRE